MKQFILGFMFSASLGAAAVVLDSGDNGNRFFSLNGKELTPQEAYSQKDKFLKCSIVEVHYNKNTGKPSIKK